MNHLQAGREILWNVSSPAVMYGLFFISLMIFTAGIFRHVRMWRRGRPDNDRFSHPARRLILMLGAVFFQKKTGNTLFPGIFHGMIFYSFVGLFLATLAIFSDTYFGTALFRGAGYFGFTVLCEIAGLVMIIGVAAALWRRHVIRPKTLDRTAMDTVSLLLLGAIAVTGFMVEGARMASSNDPNAGLSFVGNAFSLVMTGTGKNGHAALWWLHTVLVMGWIAAIPYTKLFHLVLLPVNAFFSRQNPAGALDRIDLEALMESEDVDEEDLRFGIGSTADLTWKQRMDLDACVGCGRCEDVCPAFCADQPLSPKHLIQSMFELTRENKEEQDNSDAPVLPEKDIVGDAFDSDFIWYCRTCMACVNICPAYIAHLDTLIDIRRNEVSMKGRLPSHAASALKTMESLGNPFAPQKERMAWTDGLDVRVVQAGAQCDVLFWTGCFTALDPDKHDIPVNIFRLLQRMGIDAGILGPEEHCCGDPARVIGDENMFQQAAKEQVAALNARTFNQLLVACPHGYTVLKDEYPQFGGKYSVTHYTEFFHQAVRQQAVRFANPYGDKTVAYHDPCYLGRYQGIFDAPRQLIDRIPGLRRIELNHHHAKSFCCGGGGGHFWMDFPDGRRINVMRVQQALDAGAQILITACPFCRHMLDDGIKMLDAQERICVQDISAVLLDAVESGHGE